MRSCFLAFFTLAVFVTAGARAYGDDLTFTLNPTSGTGSPTTGVADPGNCLSPNCVLFDGTLLDTDTDGASVIYLFNPNDPSIPSISVAFSNSPASGSLSLDNSFYEVAPVVLSSDITWATDNLGNPPDTYIGPIFGIDIAPGTSVGAYSGTITINAAGGLGDPGFSGFSVNQNFTVDVIAPEPAATSLFLTGMLFLAAWRRMRYKWRSPEASR